MKRICVSFRWPLKIILFVALLFTSAIAQVSAPSLPTRAETTPPPNVLPSTNSRLPWHWPEARNYSSLVYDTTEKALLLISGQDASYGLVPSIWSFNPGNRSWRYVADWQPQDFDMAAFDSSSGKVIVYVSWYFRSTGDVVSETWAFDPKTATWENRFPVESPPPGLCGCGAQVAYDEQARKIVMFGGLDVSQLFKCFSNGCDDAGWLACETNDTWVYDYSGNRWTKMPRPADENLIPSRRNSHGLTYDRRAHRIILFGGGDLFGPATDTWAYDYVTNTWTNLQPVVSPPGREYGYLAYDPTADKTVLFGGIGYDSNSEWLLPAETWNYDLKTNTWKLRTPARTPSARGWQAMAYSDKANAVVIFGGGVDRQHPTDETWLYRTGANKWWQVEP